VEDLAGLMIVATIAVSALVAAFQAIDRLVHPRAVEFLGAVVAASIIGFAGNEIVAIFRIRVGRQIGSAALTADGYHARVDGWTSLAVLVGAIGVWAGYPMADAVVGLVIAVAILVIAWQSARAVLARALDSVEPAVRETITHAAGHVPGVEEVTDVKARWVGHRLYADVSITVDAGLTVGEGHEIAREVRHQLLHHLPHVGSVMVHVDPHGAGGERYHWIGRHAHDGLAVHAHDHLSG
jgi:cation diffusion facilitator family transporter